MASQTPPPQAEVVVDLVTHIQGETSHLCSHFFNFTGSLQRDASPVSLGGEPLAPSRLPATSAETLSHVPSMAEQVRVEGLLKPRDSPLHRMPYIHVPFLAEQARALGLKHRAFTQGFCIEL